MAKHNETGTKGEQIAEIFLLNRKYEIIARNWRFGKKEVDCIVRKNDAIVFVEVKTRSSTAFGFPEEYVTPQKQQYLKAAAAAWIEANPIPDGYVRFDVISILLQNGAVYEIRHFEEAFY
jgi:putative endonuclease